MTVSNPAVRDPEKHRQGLVGGVLEQQRPGRVGDSPAGPEALMPSPRRERVQLSREGWGLGCSAPVAVSPVPEAGDPGEGVGFLRLLRAEHRPIS